MSHPNDIVLRKIEGTIRKATRWLVGAIVLLGVIGLLGPYLDRPFGLDHGQFAWVGQLVASGGVPYRDAWDIKGPAVHLAYAAFDLVLGRQTWGIRVVDLLFMALAARLLWRIAHPRLGAPHAWAAVAVFGTWYLGLNYESTAQPDGWAGVLVLVVVSQLLGPRLSAARLTFLGTLLGVCALTKPTYAVCGVVVIAHALLERDRSVSERLRGVAVSIGGALIPVVLVVSWLAWREGLVPYLDITRYAAVVYTQNAPLVDKLQRLARELAGSPSMAVAFGLSLVGLRHLHRSSRNDGWLLGAWLAAALLVLVLGSWFYPYHWLPAYPALSLLALAGAASVGEFLSRVRPRLAGAFALAGPIATAVVLGGPSLARAASTSSAWWAATWSPARRTAYEQRTHGEDGRHSTSLLAVAQYVRDRTDPGEPLEYFGTKAGFYYFADRPAATRFGQTQPLLGGGDNPQRRRYRGEFLEIFGRRPARYLVARADSLCAKYERPPFDCLGRFPEFAALVGERYAVDTVIGPHVVRRLDDQSGPRR